MNSIHPTRPGFIFGYWRPWKESADLIDSYLDYTKDISLANYSADLVGRYVQQASKEQVQALDRVTKSIDHLSSQVAYSNSLLEVINRNTAIITEQNHLSNILLGNIAELVALPDSEKERRNSIEQGIKYLAHAANDPSLYEDALEYLLRAESYMKQDYFVLYNIGLIYLHSRYHIDIQKALHYFSIAAKYASIDNIPNNEYVWKFVAAKDISPDIKSRNIQMSESDIVNSERLYELVKNRDKNDLHLQILSSKSKKRNNIIIIESVNSLKTIQEFEKMVVRAIGNTSKIISKRIESGGVGATKWVYKLVYPDYPLMEANNAQRIINEIDEVMTEIVAAIGTRKRQLKEFERQLQESRIEQNWKSGIYDKAAFCAYILGDFNLSCDLQQKAVGISPSGINLFSLAKYQSRNDQADDALDSITRSILQTPELYNAVSHELDLIANSAIMERLELLEKSVTLTIKKEIAKLGSILSSVNSDRISGLLDLLKDPYPKKASTFPSHFIP